MLQANPKKKKTLFSRLTKTLNDMEKPLNPNQITIANQIPSVTFASIGQRLGNYAIYLKQARHPKPRKLPIVAG